MTPPAEVLAAWGWAPDEVAPLAGGLINTTYVVTRGGARIAVVQRLHPVFGPEVNLDLEAVTAHLAQRGLETPRLVRTLDGAAWIEHDARTWRALSWVDGASTHAVPSLAHAEAGGALVGRFHRAVDDLDHEYRFARAGGEPEAVELAADILSEARTLAPIGELPRRHSHGDLKISNILFRGAEAIALVDLDTLGRQTIAFELGDAMRSWCNPHPEDAGRAHFDLDVFAAAMRGYRDVAGALLTRDEWPAIVLGLETVCVELAARFAADVFEDRYFGWDPARFPSRRAHNLIRARGQLALARDVAAHRDDALAIVLGG